jgi:hypothetical protein
MAAVGLCFVIWKVPGLRKIDAAKKLALHDEASLAGQIPEAAFSCASHIR